MKKIFLILAFSSSLFIQTNLFAGCWCESYKEVCKKLSVVSGEGAKKCVEWMDVCVKQACSDDGNDGVTPDDDE